MGAHDLTQNGLQLGIKLANGFFLIFTVTDKYFFLFQEFGFSFGVLLLINKRIPLHKCE